MMLHWAQHLLLDPKGEIPCKHLDLQCQAAGCIVLKACWEAEKDQSETRTQMTFISFLFSNELMRNVPRNFCLPLMIHLVHV